MAGAGIPVLVHCFCSSSGHCIKVAHGEFADLRKLVGPAGWNRQTREIRATTGRWSDPGWSRLWAGWSVMEGMSTSPVVTASTALTSA